MRLLHFMCHTFPSFLSNSTYTKSAFGQNRVTERKEALQTGKRLGFPENRKGENNYEQQEQQPQENPYRAWTYQNCGVHSDHWYITAHKKE